MAGAFLQVILNCFDSRAGSGPLLRSQPQSQAKGSALPQEDPSKAHHLTIANQPNHA